MPPSRVLFVLTVVMATVIPALAQGPPPPPPLNEVPLDGFTTALIAAGVGYGLKRSYRRESRHEGNF